MKLTQRALTGSERPLGSTGSSTRSTSRKRLSKGGRKLLKEQRERFEFAVRAGRIRELSPGEVAAVEYQPPRAPRAKKPRDIAAEVRETMKYEGKER